LRRNLQLAQAKDQRPRNDAELLANLDELTKQGRRTAVMKELAKILKAGPAIGIRPALARIANRNQAYVLAMRIQQPIIRAHRENVAKASAETWNVYASSLMGIGALEEAEAALKFTKGLPEALLTEAFVHFARWDYAKAIPFLERHGRSKQVAPYQKLVGRINLLAGHIAVGDIREARALAESLIPVLEAGENTKLLFGNSLELRAQLEMLEGNFAAALSSLDRSAEILQALPGRYLLYVNKWRAVAKLSLDPTDAEARAALAEVRQEAKLVRNWETIRDCDFHLARLTGDNVLLQRILLGTPYAGYRARVKSIFGIDVESDKHLEYNPASQNQTPKRLIWQIEDQSCGSSWPLVQAMTKDIYRPPRMGVVFSALYPGEYFDPFSSPGRVRNSIFRFNDIAAELKIPFRLRMRHGDFLFEGPSEVGIGLERRARSVAPWQMELAKFKTANGARSFTSSDLAEFLTMTPRSAVSLIEKAVAVRKLEKMGRGKNTRYIFFSGRRKKVS
jgi:hypothetical protein